MKVTLTKISPTRLNVHVEKGDTVVYHYDFTATAEKKQVELAERLGIKLVELTPFIMKAMEDDISICQLEDKDKVSFWMRGLYERSGDSIEFDNFIDVIGCVDYPAEQPVIKWSGQDKFCCVDIDYHKTPLAHRPSFDMLRAMAATIRPIPICYHPSHGRGAKLYYQVTNGYQANELAAAGALSWLNRDGRATAELKNETRHPRYSRGDEVIPADDILFRNTPDSDLEAVARMFAQEVSQDSINNYLEENGLRLYHKYAHDKCPINPHIQSHAEPVFIGDYGISCHKCTSEGVSLGTRRTPGFVPYTALVYGPAAEIASLARHCVHWSHAEFVLKQQFRTPLAMLKLAYRCALKLIHGACDPRVDAVFRTENIARVNGKWIFVGDKNNTTVLPHAKRIYEKLPVTWIVTYNSEGIPKIKSDWSKVESISHTGRSLVEYGYDDLKPVTGMQMWGHRLPYIQGVIPIPDSFSHIQREYRPSYIPASQRQAEHVEWAWQKLEEVFPGINRDYVRLLVAMRGVVEAGINNVYLLVVATTGVGKTTTGEVVAGLLGDKSTTIVYNGSEERLRQGIAKSITIGSFTFVDELFKKADVARQSARQALDPILTLTPSSMSHELYTGHVQLGGCSVIAITDIEMPLEIRADAQLSRRIIYVPLSGRVDWDVSIPKAGINAPNEFRKVSPDHNLAADILCSHWIDEFFDRPKSVKELLSQTPFKFLEETKEFGDPKVILRQFYEQVCKAPELTGKDAERYPASEGWKVISTSMTDDLRDIWDQLANGTTGAKWKQSRRVMEEDFSRLFRLWFNRKVPNGTAVDFRHFKETTIYVRFRLDDSGRELYNESIPEAFPLLETE